MQIIAVCEMKEEDTTAQILFWEMMNEVMLNNGHPLADFRGFMADEANANWIAVRTVYFGGAKNKSPSKERSCLFHWAQSMVRHTSKCIRPAFQEEHKILCRKWLDAPSEHGAEVCKEEIRNFWHAGAAVDHEIPSLETWLSWWDVRVPHWGDRFLSQEDSGVFVPRTICRSQNMQVCVHLLVTRVVLDCMKQHVLIYHWLCFKASDIMHI